MTILFLAIGAVAGILAGLFGIGGGVLMVGGMVALAKLPFTTATGTSLGAMILPVGILCSEIARKSSTRAVVRE